MSVQGTLEEPAIALGSTPSYSQRELINLIVSGDTRESGSTTALGGQAAAFLVGGRLSRGLRRFGFDEVTIRPELVAREAGAETGARFTFGKHLTSWADLVYSLSLKDPEGRFLLLEVTPGYDVRLMAQRTDEGQLVYGSASVSGGAARPGPGRRATSASASARCGSTATSRSSSRSCTRAGRRGRRPEDDLGSPESRGSAPAAPDRPRLHRGRGGSAPRGRRGRVRRPQRPALPVARGGPGQSTGPGGRGPAVALRRGRAGAGADAAARRAASGKVTCAPRWPRGPSARVTSGRSCSRSIRDRPRGASRSFPGRGRRSASRTCWRRPEEPRACSLIPRQRRAISWPPTGAGTTCRRTSAARRSSSPRLPSSSRCPSRRDRRRRWAPCASRARRCRKRSSAARPHWSRARR